MLTSKKEVLDFILEDIKVSFKDYEEKFKSSEPQTVFMQGFLYGVLFQTQNSLERYVEDVLAGKSSIKGVVNQKLLAKDYHLLAHELQSGRTTCGAIDLIEKVLNEKINQRIDSLLNKEVNIIDDAPSAKQRCDGKSTQAPPDPLKAN